MPIYATRADAIDLYGAEYVGTVGDQDQDGIMEPGPLDRALEEVSREIESYAEPHIDLPSDAASAPRWWRRAAVDLALDAVPSEGTHSMLKKERAKMWRDRLEKVYPSAGSDDGAVVTGGVRMSATTREFTVSKMVGL